MGKSLIVIGLALVLFGVASHAAEHELADVSLMDPIAKTVKALSKRYGKAHVQKVGNVEHTLFITDRKKKTQLIISPHPTYKKLIGAVQVSGTSPIKNLNFLGAVNLGDPDMKVRRGLPVPSHVGPSADGFVLYRFGEENYSVETKNGIVASIRIGAEGDAIYVCPRKNDQSGCLFLTRGESAAYQSQIKFLPKKEVLQWNRHDALKPFCSYRHPLQWIRGAYYLTVSVGVSKDNLHQFRFLLDSGYPTHRISQNVCDSLGCKTLGTKKWSESFEQTKVSGGLIELADEFITMENFFLQSSQEVVGAEAMDGVIGGDFLLSQNLVLNLKLGYLCKLREPLEHVARKIGMQSIKAEYEGGRVWTDFKVGKRVAKDYLFDTGSDRSSLVEKDIQKFKLKRREAKDEERQNVDGKYLATAYGPVVVDLGGIRVETEFVLKAPDDAFRKLGNDVLSGLIIAFQPRSKIVYVGR